MNVEKLNELMTLDNSSLAGRRGEIAKLVEEFPYSGPFRMLLAKASKESGHLDQRKDLLAAAAHCSSRKALFDIMFSEKFIEQAKAVHEEIEQLDDVSEEELVDLVWHSSEEEKEDPSDIEREEVIEAISAVLEENTSEIFSEEILEKSKVVEIASDLEEDEPQIREGGSAESLFGKWLAERAQATHFGEARNTENLVERGAAAIIDAFLAKDNPQIGKVRDVDSPVSEWASKGLEEDASLVTETMAKLYAKQGQLGRARKAFKHLALKYPDKSVYFAAQLKKLSKK